jgi:hypothetical protein
MSQQKKPRNKKYKPQPRRIPVLFRFGSEDERDMQMYPHAELLKLRTGNADESTWHCLTARLNIGQTVAYKSKQSDEVKAAFHAALDAMRSIFRRHESTGKWGATGDEMAVIGEGLVLTDDLQKTSTRRLLRDATELVYREAGVPSVRDGVER